MSSVKKPHTATIVGSSASLPPSSPSVSSVNPINSSLANKQNYTVPLVFMKSAFLENNDRYETQNFSVDYLDYELLSSIATNKL